MLYIAVGTVTSVAVLVAIAFSLLVLVPAVIQLAVGIDDSLDARVLNATSFSKFATNKTYVRRSPSPNISDRIPSHLRFLFCSCCSKVSNAHDKKVAQKFYFLAVYDS